MFVVFEMVDMFLVMKRQRWNAQLMVWLRCGAAGAEPWIL